MKTDSVKTVNIQAVYGDELREFMVEIRLTSLNLAIASSKFKVKNATQEKIKRDPRLKVNPMAIALPW